MKLTYIFHSGFAVELTGCIIIIDFYKDSINETTGIVHDSILKNAQKPIYVLSTHSHYDHFNSEILEWRKLNSNIKYIFSSEIAESTKKKEDNVIYLDKLETYKDDLLKIKAFGSTDLGGSFLIEHDTQSIFHAGDLNNWHWKEESTNEEIEEAETWYLNELSLLYQEQKEIDLVMFPIDHRLGKDYCRGGIQFLEKIRTHFFAPMHFGEDYKSANHFKEYAERNNCHFLEINKRGETFTI